MSIKSRLKHYKTPFLLAIISLFFYVLFAYQLERTDYIKLITLYTGLFILSYKLIEFGKIDFKFLVLVAVLFRLVFLFAIPNLSQDFYRFIWDGRMLLQGLNPYLTTPLSFISSGDFPIHQAEELYIGMRALNGSHYTNYPPINQLCFLIAGVFGGKSIIGAAIIMRVLIIFADIGTLYFGKKLLEKLNLPIHTIFWYILNPFIIIELAGNLHFESVMIFFLVWSLYLLHIGKWRFAAIVFALSISVKLIPLIFLPLFFQWFVKKDENKKPSKKDSKFTLYFSRFTKIGLFYGLIGLTTIALFLPFYSSQFYENYTETVGLWFQNFEFNASFYYIVRELAYGFRGYNEIAIIGKIIPIVVIIFILILTFFRKNKTTIELITAMLLILSFYYFTSTTVHPWYIATLLILSIFTKYKFPVVWSFIIIISYLAYANSNNTENLWIIGLEYLVVYGYLFWELFIKTKLPVRTQTKTIKIE
jgi:alpha-1,6-mannosyltransferase